MSSQRNRQQERRVDRLNEAATTTDEKRLRRLGVWSGDRDPDPELRQLVALNLHTPDRTLLRLAAHPDPWVRVAVAANPVTPTSILDVLARDARGGQHPEVIQAVAERLDLDSHDRIGALAAEYSPTAARYLAEHSAHPDTLASIARRHVLVDPDTITAVINNPATPTHALRDLEGDDRSTSDQRVEANRVANLRQLELSEDPETRLRAVAHLAEHRARRGETLRPQAEEVVREVAHDRDTPLPVLDDLARSDDPAIRQIVAGNWSVSDATLEALADDADEQVRRSARSHQTARVERAQFAEATAKREAAWAVLDEWRGERLDDRIESAWAADPNTPLPVLEAIAEVEIDEVRAMVAFNLNCSEQLAADVLSKVEPWAANLASPDPADNARGIAEHPDADVRRAAAFDSKNPLVLWELSDDPDPAVRAAVARNASVDADVLAALAFDADFDVATTATDVVNVRSCEQQAREACAEDAPAEVVDLTQEQAAPTSWRQEPLFR